MSSYLRLVTDIEMAANAAAEWRAQYAHWRDDELYADATSKGQIGALLAACRHTPANIKNILNEGWVSPYCFGCRGYVGAVVEFARCGGDPYALCHECLRRAYGLMRQYRCSQSESANQSLK